MRAPITTLLFITFTNLHPGPLTLASYSVEVRTKGEPWQKMTRIPISSDWGRVFYTPSSFSKAAPIEFKDIFDELIRGKKIPPNDTVSGWIFLEVPEQYAGNSSLEWQFRAKDISNVELMAPVTFLHIPLNEDVQQGMAQFAMKAEAKEDISDAMPVLYSKERPR